MAIKIESVLQKRAGKLSGVWFDLQLVGGVFEKIANLLPFVHAVNLAREGLQQSFATGSFFVLLGYAIAVTLGGIGLFLRQMKKK